MASGNFKSMPSTPYPDETKHKGQTESLKDSKKTFTKETLIPKSLIEDTQEEHVIPAYSKVIPRIATEPRISISSSYSSTSEDEPDTGQAFHMGVPDAKPKYSTQSYARIRGKPNRSRHSLYHAVDYPLVSGPNPNRLSLVSPSYLYGDENKVMRIPPYVPKPTLVGSASKVHYDRVDSIASADRSDPDESASAFTPPTPLPSSTVRRAWKRGLKWLGHRRAGTTTETEEEGDVDSIEHESSSGNGSADYEPETSTSPIADAPDEDSPQPLKVPPLVPTENITDIVVTTTPEEKVRGGIQPSGTSVNNQGERVGSFWGVALRALRGRSSRLSIDPEDGPQVTCHERVKKISPPWYASTFDLTSGTGPIKYKKSTASNIVSPGGGPEDPLLKSQASHATGPIAWPRHISRRLSSRHGHFKKVRKRLVNKSGSCNIIHSHIPKRKQHFLTDIFTTLLDSKWRWAVIIFTLGFLLSWTLYAIIWWLICFSHGDFDHIGDPEWRPCVSNIVSFTSVFLFSMETQHTIGFGYRYITEECPEAVLVLIVQAITGAMIQGFVTGLIFSKLSRPKKRAVTLMFSRNAVICTRDGNLCLLVRIGDMRRSHIVDAHTRAYLFRKKVTLEGETLPLNPYNIELGFDSPGRADGTVSSDKIFLAWPCILVHRMDSPTSPFYDLGADDVRREKYEIVVILEGMIEATGMSMQARTSYLPSEILWGYRFQKLITFIREDGDYMVDYSRFHNTIPVNVPRCSARILADLRRKYRSAAAERAYRHDTDAALDHVGQVLIHVTQLLAQVRMDAQAYRESRDLPSGDTTPRGRTISTNDHPSEGTSDPKQLCARRAVPQPH